MDDRWGSRTGTAAWVPSHGDRHETAAVLAGLRQALTGIELQVADLLMDPRFEAASLEQLAAELGIRKTEVATAVQRIETTLLCMRPKVEVCNFYRRRVNGNEAFAPERPKR